MEEVEAKLDLVLEKLALQEGLIGLVIQMIIDPRIIAAAARAPFGEEENDAGSKETEIII